MPVYEFACESCGGFERRLSMSEVGAVAECPGCGGVSGRVYSMPGLGSSGNSRREGAGEPKLSRRPEQSSATGRARPVRGGRPWQVGH